MMNILLINVNYPTIYKYGDISFNILKKIMLKSSPNKQINLPILSAITPKEHTVQIKDWCQYKNIDFNVTFDIIGLSFTTEFAIEAYRIADKFREMGKTVILGGWHASALPNEAKQHADSVIIGEAEDTWIQGLNDYKNNKLKPIYRQKQPVNPKKIPILKNFKEKENQGIQATRGCPYGCRFCSVTNEEFRNIYRTRPIEDVIKEIQFTKKRSFIFYDNSLTIKPSYTKELFRKMKSLNKKFIASGNINVLAKDNELLKLAYEAGCTGWFVGFESIVQKSVNEVGKRANRVEEYLHAVKKIHDQGMLLFGSFIFGFDNDTKDVFDKTIEINQKLMISEFIY